MEWKEWRDFIVLAPVHRVAQANDSLWWLHLLRYKHIYVAFKDNPQGYRQLSSSIAPRLFWRTNCTYLPVSLFWANRCDDEMSTSFGLRWVFFFFFFCLPLPMWFHSATSSFVWLLSLAHMYIYIMWDDSIVPFFFFFRILARVDMRSMVSMPSITELLYFENVPIAKPMIGSLRVSLAFSFTPV